MRGHALEGADAQLHGVPAGAELRFGRREAGLDRARVHEQTLAGLGERERLRDARAIHELRADDALERGELLADGRLRIAEAARGAMERRLLREGLERSQMANLDPVPSAPPNAFGHARSLSRAAPSPGNIWSDIDPTPRRSFS